MNSVSKSTSIRHGGWQSTHRRRKVKSAVPGCAERLSAAPPTTMQMALPSPFRRIFEHDVRDTLHTPSASIMSLYIGTLKFDPSVSKCGRMPGNALENPVASVAKVAKAPLHDHDECN